MKPFLHERIFFSLLLELASGYYPKHSRFISLRKASEMFRASKPTTGIAFGRLCEEGYLEPAPKSGYRVTPKAREKAMLALRKNDLQLLPAPHDWKLKRARLQSSLRQRPLNVVVIYFMTPRSLESDVYIRDEQICAFRCSGGCRDAAIKHCVSLSFACLDGSPERLTQLHRALDAKDIDGVIVIQRNALIKNFKEVVAPLVKRGVPVLNVFGEHDSVDVISMDFNNISAAYKATQTFAEKNLKKIIVITTCNGGHTHALRSEGALLAARNLDLDVEIFPYDFSLKNGGLAPLLKKHRNKQIGILSFFHDGVLAVKRVCNQLGYQIPDKLSLIGFTSTPHVPDMGFSFDVMKLDFDKMGRVAIETMVSLLQGKAVHRCILVDPDYEAHGTVVSRAPAKGHS